MTKQRIVLLLKVVESTPGIILACRNSKRASYLLHVPSGRRCRDLLKSASHSWPTLGTKWNRGREQKADCLAQYWSICVATKIQDPQWTLRWKAKHFASWLSFSSVPTSFRVQYLRMVHPCLYSLLSVLCCSSIAQFWCPSPYQKQICRSKSFSPCTCDAPRLGPLWNRSHRKRQQGAPKQEPEAQTVFTLVGQVASHTSSLCPSGAQSHI